MSLISANQSGVTWNIVSATFIISIQPRGVLERSISCVTQETSHREEMAHATFQTVEPLGTTWPMLEHKTITCMVSCGPWKKEVK